MTKAELAWTPNHDALLDHAAQAAREFRSATAARPHRPEKDFAAMRELFAAIPLPERGAPAREVIAELADLAEPGLEQHDRPAFLRLGDRRHRPSRRRRRVARRGVGPEHR